MSSPTLPEYRGMMLPHIMRIMAYMNQISPPLVYPHNGPRENPRLPVQAGQWTLGSNTSPGGKLQAPITDPVTNGHYYVGDRWPGIQIAPQAVLWVPPKFPTCRYVGNPDRVGDSRNLYEDDPDLYRMAPEACDILTAIGADKLYSYRRTGALVQPWTVMVYGNSWEDTEILAHWVASTAHDVERSHPERLGEGFTALNGGWTDDKPGDRGLAWQMTVCLTMPVVRSDKNVVEWRYTAGTYAEEFPAPTCPLPDEGVPVAE